MVKFGILAKMVAKEGKENDVEAFLNSGLSLVEEEPETKTWYAFKIDKNTFGIFDTFEEESGRKAHLSGKVAEALMAKADELFSEPPSIQQVDVIAAM